MKIVKLLFLFSFFIFSILYAQEKKVDELFEKVNQASTPEEKKELIEKLKKKLALENKKAQEEADAIIKAKEKMPQKFYKDVSSK